MNYLSFALVSPLRTIFTAFFCLFLFLAGASAQAINATVSGTVKDQTGAVIVEAKVVLKDNATGRELTAVTNAEGYFLFPDALAGNYTVSAERSGFRKVTVQGVTVNVGVPATLNIELQTGEISEVVTTTASEAQSVVNTENAELQTTVLTRQINDLPLDGRNVLNLAGLQAGVNGFVVNGMRGTFTNLTWDGININDNFVRTDGFFGFAIPRAGSVSEFTLTTQNGGASGGLGVTQVTMVTPRGTNEWHGSLFEYHRNDALDANSFFNNAAGLPKEKLIRNQFGVNFGGPIKFPKKVFGPLGFDTKKLFFYSYYEGTRERIQSSTENTVLTTAARQGRFTYRRLDNGNLQTLNLLNLVGLGNAVDPIAQRYIALTPLPNSPTSGDLAAIPGGAALSNVGGYRFNAVNDDDADQWGFRIDYEASSKHRFEAIYGRYDSLAPNDIFNGNGSPFPGLPGGGQRSKRPRSSFAWNWTPSTRLLNEVRAGFANYNVSLFTNEKFADGFQLGFPLITNPVQNFLPQGRQVNNFELMDNVTLLLGRHQIRTGGGWRRIYLEPYSYGGVLPAYALGYNDVGTFNPLDPGFFPGGISEEGFGTATGLLAALTAPVAALTQTFNVTSRNSGFVVGAPDRQEMFYYGLSGYANDAWRVRKNLTLNLGLRYEYISVPTERRGLRLLPRNGLAALRDPNATLDFVGTGTGRKLFGEDLNNFAPNISFSWDPFGNGKTAIRGGYTLSYVIDNNITTVLNATGSNGGLSATINMQDTDDTLSQLVKTKLATPQFKVPRTTGDNLALDFTSGLFTIDPKLRTPYVQQWTFGIEREILPDTVLEVRYVGNRGTKLTRGVDINQLRVLDNGFLEDFQRAQRNLALPTADPAVGERLQIFPRLGDFTPYGLGYAFLNTQTVQSLIRTGQVGELANLYITNRDLFLDPSNGFGVTLGPDYFLRANPNTYVADYIGNGSWSTYHGLQAEVRRRLKNGLYFQANYTWSKAFTDFEGDQDNFSGLLDLGAGYAVEKQRISADYNHVFKANWIYDLPFGAQHRLLNNNAVVRRIFGGWSLTGLLDWYSGAPISILSGRGTLNRAGRSGKNTAVTTLSREELQKRTGIYKDQQGRILLFDPSLIGADGRANTQVFSNPVAGKLGTLQLYPISGPAYFSIDFGFIKRTTIKETINLEFRAEAFNLLNNVNFSPGQAQNINSTSFGQITSASSPRILQLALKVNF